LKKSCQAGHFNLGHENGSEYAGFFNMEKRQCLESMNTAMIGVLLQPAIRGKITDPLHCPVASARVRLFGSKLTEKRSTFTGNQGSFMFNRVPPGVYTLEVTYTGFSKLVQRGIVVQEHSITALDVKMGFEEDSRTLRLRALQLDYVSDPPGRAFAAESLPVERQLREVVDALRLDKALFNPPLAVKAGRSSTIELGIYQNLKEEVTHRLLERKVDLRCGEPLRCALSAELQVTGCRVMPGSQPRMEVEGARYVEWRWDILPQVAGRGLMRLDLRVHASIAGREGAEKCLLMLERNILIRRSLRLALRQAFVRLSNKEALPGHPED
jgi:hypothetical protein